MSVFPLKETFQNFYHIRVQKINQKFMSTLFENNFYRKLNYLWFPHRKEIFLYYRYQKVYVSNLYFNICIDKSSTSKNIYLSLINYIIKYRINKRLEKNCNERFKSLRLLEFYVFVWYINFILNLRR